MPGCPAESRRRVGLAGVEFPSDVSELQRWKQARARLWGACCPLGRRMEGCEVLKSKHWEDETQGGSFTVHKGETMDPTARILTIGGISLKIRNKSIPIGRVHAGFCKVISLQLITAG